MNQRTKTKKEEKNTLCVRCFRVGALMGCVIFSFSVIFHVASLNALATKGYVIRSMENEITELRQEYKNQKIDEAQLVSPYRIQRETGNLGLEENEEMYAVYETGRFAFRR